MIKKLLRKRRGKEKDVLRELVPYRTMDADTSLKGKFSSIVAETGFWKDGNHVRDAYADYLAHEWAHFPPIKAHVRREFRKYACYSTRPTAKGQKHIDSMHPAFKELRIAHRPLAGKGSSNHGFVLVDSLVRQGMVIYDTVLVKDSERADKHGAEWDNEDFDDDSSGSSGSDSSSEASSSASSSR